MSDEVQLGHTTAHIHMLVINLTTLETTLAGTQWRGSGVGMYFWFQKAKTINCGHEKNSSQM
jgi:hypothetical protein